MSAPKHVWIAGAPQLMSDRDYEDFSFHAQLNPCGMRVLSAISSAVASFMMATIAVVLVIGYIYIYVYVCIYTQYTYIYIYKERNVL